MPAGEEVPGGSGTPAAVLLDMDGTLVDTEGLWWQAVAAVAESLGRPLSPADLPHIHGRTIEDAAAHLLRNDPPAADGELVAEVIDRLTVAFAERVRRDLTVMPGAPELLADLAATAIPTALVSASPRSVVELVLPRLGHRFDLVIANEDTARGKPHPDPYLEAARRLGTPPSSCVAIEDSPTGIASATAAGCRVLVASPEAGLPSFDRVRRSLPS
ncbi:haloacid dehalogenase superfamily, subfamily IA, variant 3 with third motif having DD or ED [Nonomuraea jiangxiensis]|uniref:Haloacid dehalogenase superfamily, subfamily IA, variant 3 with third motif having DD or ED n=2 Tax=Nonomuraea jiangxiensis TaxID=633440 RepID=A0A1G9FYD2_9ACTN|nr:haloacid dehalogenase superfamily, subfamily IA, variant 3 with third motif having DD or ED [Nonomuraea jiangxiensis]